MNAAERYQRMVDSFDLLMATDEQAGRPICDLFVNSEGQCSFRLHPPVYPWTRQPD